MEQFFVALNTILFSSFKQMLDAITALDDKPMDFKVFQSSLGLFIFLSKISFIEFSFLFPNDIFNLMLNFFENLFVSAKLL